MELFELFISEDLTDKSGVDDISAVDSPAIGDGYFVFNKQKDLKRLKLTFGNQKGDFTPVEGDKQILVGALMIPDLEIYRVSDNGQEYNVQFPASEIAKIQRKFKMLGYNTNINEMHDPNKRIDNSVLFQDYIVNRAFGLNPPKGKEHLPDGTWVGFVYVGDKKLYDEYMKTGIYTGFSVGGFFYDRPVIKMTDEVVSQLVNILK